MDSVISFTPAQLLALILAICGAIVTISAAIGVITKAIDRAKAPEKQQDERLSAIERRLDENDKTVEKFKEFFANDDSRFKAINKSNKVIQTALLALLKHSLNGNDTDSLKEAEKSLEEFLIDK